MIKSAKILFFLDIFIGIGMALLPALFGLKTGWFVLPIVLLSAFIQGSFFMWKVMVRAQRGAKHRGIEIILGNKPTTARPRKLTRRTQDLDGRYLFHLFEFQDGHKEYFIAEPKITDAESIKRGVQSIYSFMSIEALHNWENNPQSRADSHFHLEE